MSARKKTPGVSLVIPIYNEGRHLLRFLREIDSLRLGKDKELIFVNDGSRDNSAEIIAGFKFKSRIQFLDLKVNAGKGAAIRKGIDLATGDIVGIQDADFEYRIQDIPLLLRAFQRQGCDVVFGSRFSKLNPQVHRTFHYLVNRFLTLLSNFLSGLYVSDMETCYKFFRREILQNIILESNRFGFEPEITAKIARLKVRVHELPISYFPRNYIEGKKITWKDGLAAIWHIFYFNLFSSKKRFFKETMPDQYVPKSSQWL